MVVYMFLKKMLSGTIILIFTNQRSVKSISLTNNLGVKNMEGS